MFPFFSWCAAAILTFNTTSSNSELIVPGAQLKKIADTFAFTEGPARNTQGDIYFTDQPNDRIWIYTHQDQLILFKEGTGRANGLYFHPDGTLWACSDEQHEIRAYHPLSSFQLKMPGRVNGRRFNGPNDLWIHPHTQTVYFTDPFYPRPYWPYKNQELGKQGVYALFPGQTIPVLLDETLVQPNGIIGSPDGKFLYVADIKDQKTYRYQINAQGALKDRQLWTSMGSDGMTVDEQGNVYLTGKGVTIFNPKGEKIAHIPVPEPWTANVTFGGKDKKTLFITASKSIYTLAMQVEGR